MIIETLKTQPVLLIFIVVALGYLIGNINIKGFSFGPVAGVLFAGLAFGHFGCRLSADTQSLGFALFIFSVGYQAGPRFFDVLRTDGLKYFLLALVIAVVGFSLAAVLARSFGFAPGAAAGLLSGGLTSSPTLAAAQEAIRGGMVAPPDGYTADGVIGNISTSYAITYIFGLAGLIALIKILPMVLKLDLPAMARELEKGTDNKKGAPKFRTNHVCARTFRLTNEDWTQGPALGFLDKYRDGITFGELRRQGNIIKIDAVTQFEIGDEIVLVGPAEFFTGAVKEIGEEIPTTSSIARFDSARIVVIKPEAVGKTLGELQVARHYGVLLTRVSRSGHEFPRTEEHVIRKGDILAVTGPHENIDHLGETLGHIERSVPETDMVTFAAGIAAGVAIGLLSVKVGGVSIGLGSAGGMLTSGITIGFLRSIHPTFGRLPEPVRWIFMEFGLLLFMAGVGLRAGGDIIETFMNAGPKLVVAGIIVTVVPVLIGYFFGRKVLKLNPVLLLGGITGSMTSGASLSIVNKTSQSNVPALGYTGAYAFANVLLTIAGSLILLL